MIAAALIMVAGAMLLVRIGWSGRPPVATVGCGLAVIGLVLLTHRDGAWGLAIGTAAGIVSVLAIVLHAGWASPAKALRPAREAPSVVIPVTMSDVARRVAVFALVVPGAFLAAQWLAFGVQAVARRGGAGDADTIVLALYLQPVLWAVIMTVQMTRAGAARMIAPPVAAALIGTGLWSVS